MSRSSIALSVVFTSQWLGLGRPAFFRAVLLAFCVLQATASSPIAAQAVTGAGAEAKQLPKGAVRLIVAGTWDGYNEVYTPNGSRPMLHTLAADALGVRRLPQLGAAEQAIRSLSGLTTFALSLGPLEASGDVRQSITPISVELGVTRKLSVGLVVPYVESRDNALLVLNRNGTGATVGQNPAFGASTGTFARNVNGTLLRQLAQSRTQLSAEITRCATPTATGCDAIRADPAGAQQLVSQTLATQTAIVAVYGDSLRGGAPVVPINNSATQIAINTRIGTLRSAFAGFGITSLTASALPASAVVVNGPGATSRITADSAYGLDYTTLGGTRRAGIGDIDLTASYLWLNTLGERPAQWLAAKGIGFRSQVTAGWRFGTAGADRTNAAFDVPIGSGANALLARSTTDIVFNRFVWMSGTVRIVQPLGDQVVIRQPLFVDSLLFVPSTVASASRSLGRRVDVELAPRISLGQYFGLSSGYLYQRVAADQYVFGAIGASSASTMSVASRGRQSLMFGVTYSTLSSYVNRRSKWPLEALFVHITPIAGSGDAMPAVSTDHIELRVYTGFPRR